MTRTDKLVYFVLTVVSLSPWLLWSYMAITM